MSDNRLVIEGLAELKEALSNLPQELVDEASGVVDTKASVAAREIRANYPEGPLRDSVEVLSFAHSAFSAGVYIVVNDPIAFIFENGTELRFYKGQARGRMPAAHAFIPPMVRHRRDMYRELKTMLESHGITVEGDV
jgi:hypothetical protein